MFLESLNRLAKTRLQCEALHETLSRILYHQTLQIAIKPRHAAAF